MFIFASTMHIYINDDIENFDLTHALPMLSLQRREQVMRYKHEMGRKLCAAAYLLLCQGLKEIYGIVEPPIFTYGEHGKPEITGHPEIRFNVSHCQVAAICAISNRPIGVDIEHIRNPKDSLVNYTMNEEESKSIMESSNRSIAFTRLWTMKEALMKQQGTGIDNRIKEVLMERHVPIKTFVNEGKGYVYSIACEE